MIHPSPAFANGTAWNYAELSPFCRCLMSEGVSIMLGKGIGTRGKEECEGGGACAYLYKRLKRRRAGGIF